MADDLADQLRETLRQPAATRSRGRIFRAAAATILALALVSVCLIGIVGISHADSDLFTDLHDREGRIPGLRSILAIDSISAAIGGAFGVSSVTSYIESAAGVAEGARTWGWLTRRVFPASTSTVGSGQMPSAPAKRGNQIASSGGTP